MESLRWSACSQFRSEMIVPNGENPQTEHQPIERAKAALCAMVERSKW
jgi:hypothetical protein